MKWLISKWQLLFLGSLFCAAAQAQGNDASKKIIDKLSQFEANYPAEKAYLQFDKQYYAAGDTIYFKAYVTAGGLHKLSSLSGVLHVELINTKNKIDQSIKLQLDGGLAWGDFALPDSLPADSYRIRAYTQWMRNDGDFGFFERVIPIASVNAAKVPESGGKQPPLNFKPDIQFFPEGGGLIAGINTKIVFKAIGANGLGIDVSGVVVDSDHKQVAAFASAHLGMGFFYFTPAPGKTYAAKVTYRGGLHDEVNLPATETEGISLSVDNDSLPKATVTLSTNETYFNRHKGNAYTLMIYSGGLISTVDCKLDSVVTRLDILKRKLNTGIATVTLFSAAGEPLCERLFFVQNYDQLTLNAGSDKTHYTKREQATIKLNVVNRKGEPAEGHFSASVINESLVPEVNGNEDNILSNLLLTSDLKGHVEQPGYYFADTGYVARANLDLLMLSQGYRKFQWKQVLDTAQRTLALQRETGITISGRVDNLSGKPIARGLINLIPSRGVGLLTASTSDEGLFTFSNLSFTDTAHFVLNAVNSKGKNSTQITWFNNDQYKPAVRPYPFTGLPLLNDTALNAYAVNEKMEQREVANYTRGKGVMLKQVNVHEKKPDNQYRTLSLAGAGGADQVMHADEIEQIQGSLITSLDGRLHGITFLGVPPNQAPFLTGIGIRAPMLVIIDGTESSPNALYGFIANDIETVEVLKYASASIYGVGAGHGVLIVTTKQTRQLQQKDVVSIGVLPIKVMGFYKARIFYSPKYNTPATLTGKKPDLRSTIYWNPEIKTDAAGNAGFDFYNADSPGTYKVTIEGIDKDGNLGRQVYRYTVE